MEEFTPAALALLANRFKLLSSPTRLCILQHICHDERSVGELMDLTGLKQSNISRQLGLLKSAGLVKRRGDGARAFFTVADESLPKLCDVMRDSMLAQQDEMLASLSDTR